MEQYKNIKYPPNGFCRQQCYNALYSGNSVSPLVPNVKQYTNRENECKSMNRKNSVEPGPFSRGNKHG